MAPTHAPWDRQGNLLAYVDPYLGEQLVAGREKIIGNYHGVQMRPVEPFPARMSIDGIERGRSAARVIWQDEHGHRYPMFQTDLVDTLRRVDSIVLGTTPAVLWTIRKRGANYGIVVADPTRRPAVEAVAA